MTQRILKGFVLLTAAVMMTACKDDTERGDSYISFGLSSDYSDIYMNRRLGEIGPTLSGYSQAAMTCHCNP